MKPTETDSFVYSNKLIWIWTHEYCAGHAAHCLMLQHSITFQFDSYVFCIQQTLFVNEANNAVLFIINY